MTKTNTTDKHALSNRIKALGWPIKQAAPGVWHVAAPGNEDDPFIYRDGAWIEEFDGELLDTIQEYEWMTGVLKKHYT